MRKPIRSLTCQLSDIADSSHFKGILEDEIGYVTDASLYESDEETRDELSDSYGDVYNTRPSSISQKSECVPVLTAKPQSRLVKSICKNSENCDKLSGENKSQKLSKSKPVPTNTESSDQRHSQSTSSDDIEAEWTKLISPNSISKKKDEMGKIQPKHEEGSLNGSKQKRKRLCKAVELGLSAEKESRYKFKHAELKQRLQKISRTDRSKSMRTAVQGTVEINGITKHAQEGMLRHTGQKPLKGKDEMQKATATGLKQVLQKHREIKYEDVATSSSTKVQTAGTKGQTRVLQDGSVKGVKELCTSLETVHSVVEHNRHVDKDGENGIIGEEVSSGVTEGAQKKLLVINEKGTEKDSDLDVAWVLCDSCRKWRCIPSLLAEHIEATNCGWSCKENPNKKFADCSVPQEKTDAEINAELDLSEHSTCEEGDRRDPIVDSKNSTELQIYSRPGTVWTLIKHNMFLHRSRKSETIDEQHVCNCMPPLDGGIGCGDDCLNRIMNVECNAQSCPCGELCSNQQFQKRLYTKVGLFRCGKKGFGLQVLENVSIGTFIIEYVGEVLDMIAYEARQKEYAFAGQKHFYFMTLNNSEVIDACAKGNLGRFINHSCEPNCRTEKWVINGEVCIGIFAIRDIKKGEEITFDYNFVRVYGAAAKKCLCGSRECRGFIGGDPMTPPSIVDSDSSEDDPEPIMIEEKIEKESRMGGSKRQEDIQLCASLGQSDIEKNNEEKVELEDLVDENGGLCKSRYDAPKTAAKYLKLLYHAFVSKGAFESKGEALRRTRDVSMVLDALLKTQSQSILTGIVNEDGLKKFNEYIIMTRKDYRETPIVRKLLRVLEHLAANRIITIEQINSELGPESLSDTILHLCRHADVEVQQIAYRFKDKWLNLPYNIYRRFDEDIKRKDRQLSKWVQPSEEVLDATLSSGLPQSFWPFGANYTLENHNGNSEQNLSMEETDSATADARAATYPDVHSFPINAENPASVVPSGIPGVVNGIPFEHLIPDSSIGYITPEESVCVGIPVAQLHAALAAAQECTYFPQGFSSGPRLPDSNSDVKVLPSNCRSTVAQENMLDANMSDLDFGVSPSKFFKQLYNTFGSKIHPWQLQVLMAAHAWGPYLSGDARIKDLKEPGSKCWAPEFNSGANNIDMADQPSSASGYDFESDLSVSGSSPGMPPRLSSHLSRRQYLGNEHMGRSSTHYQHHNSGPHRMHKWKSQRSSKFSGHRYGNPGFRRDSSFNRRNVQQGFARQGPSRFHNKWDGPFHRHRMNGNSFSEHENVIMDADVDGTSYFGACNDVVDELEKPMALERPWGYVQGQFTEDANHSEHNQEESFPIMTSSGMEM